ncbi:hypothetical protein CVS40_8202 [Lucilia cuprina]|nr:hypothetical protein CVS40_8202 [Lucilia cuprina]
MHKEKTPLEVLGFNMITQTPLLIMHLVGLGVMRKILIRIVQNKTEEKTSKQNISAISSGLINLKKCFPKEFPRKPRSLDDLHHWKRQSSTTNLKCGCCQEVSKRLETIEKQQNSLLEILAEHKVLLDRLVSQNAVIDNIIQIFPVNTQIRTLIAGNVERNLHYVFGQGIILNFNVDGIFGKERLRDYSNVFNTLIDRRKSFSSKAVKKKSKKIRQKKMKM